LWRLQYDTGDQGQNHDFNSCLNPARKLSLNIQYIAGLNAELAWDRKKPMNCKCGETPHFGLEKNIMNCVTNIGNQHTANTTTIITSILITFTAFDLSFRALVKLLPGVLCRRRKRLIAAYKIAITSKGNIYMDTKRITVYILGDDSLSKSGSQSSMQVV
jgi:hypothetical protein